MHVSGADVIPLDVKIENVGDVQRVLGSMGDDLRRKAIRSGLRAAAKPVADKMRDLAPGRFKRAISVTQFSKRQSERLRGTLARVEIPRDGVAMIIGPNRKVDGVRVAQLAHLVEFKTRPHKIRPRNNVTSFGRDEFASGEIDHPGSDADPFMSEALRRTNVSFQRYFFEGLQKHLNRLARQQRAG